MTNVKLSRWLFVAIAIVGLAVALPVVSAHGNETTADDAPTTNATADEWATWMGAEMTEHMGPGAVEWMESHMGLTVDEMAQDMADDHDGTFERDDHTNGTVGHDDYDGRMGRQGHC